MVAELQEYTKNYWAAYFKRVTFLVYEWCINKLSQITIK